MPEDNYPGNSNKAKEHSLIRERTSLDDASVTKDKQQRSKVDGVVATRPPSTFGAVMKELFPDGFRGVRDRFIWDLLVPGLQNLFYNGWQGLGDLIFKGSVPKRNNDAPGRTSYERAYRPATSYRTYTDDYDDDYRYRVPDFQEMIFDTRETAEARLHELNEIIRKYHVLKLIDYNDIFRIPTRPTQAYYGWTSLATAYIHKVYDGYRLSMPRPVQIDPDR